MNVGENTTGSNGNITKELVQLFVVSDGELNVARDNSRTLVVARSVTSKFEDFSAQVLEDGSEVDWSTSANSSSVSSDTELSVDSSNRELESSSCGSALG